MQVLGGLADELFERIIRRALEEAWAKGRGELKQTNSVLRPSPALASSKSWLASMSEVGQLRTLATYRCHVRSWVTSGRGEEVVGTSVPSH